MHGENLDKKRKLSFGSSLHNKVDGIFIVCKNFKLYKFNFKFAKVDVGRNITNAILHHARPASTELLFGFEHSLEPGASQERRSGVFSWERHVKASGCKNIRVSRANDTWQVSASLPRLFPVPVHVTDDMVTRVAETCVHSRPPVWVWGSKSGGSLYVQPQFSVSPSPKLDSLIDDYFRSPSLVTIDTDYYLPKLSSLEESFTGMVELHCVDGERELEEKDKSYFSSLESSGWLSSVGSVLRLASQVAEEVVRGKCVVVRDADGRSSSLLVSSLAMLMMSEEFRTREGLEQVILGVWVSLGFPFNKHHTLTSPAKQSTDKHHSLLCPLFLIFLDSVHQLCHQFPAHFSFLSEYLVSVWDTCLLPVTQSFLFDCEHDQHVARSGARSPVSEVSAFNWSHQFSQEQVKH